MIVNVLNSKSVAKLTKDSIDGCSRVKKSPNARIICWVYRTGQPTKQPMEKKENLISLSRL